MVNQDNVNEKIVWVLLKMLIASDMTEKNRDSIGSDLKDLSELISRRSNTKAKKEVIE